MTETIHALTQACTIRGLDPAEARLIHHYSNAVWYLPRHDAVARVTTDTAAAARVRRTVEITRWLDRHQIAATTPLADAAPVDCNTATVSFWTYYPQPTGPAPTSAHLATALRDLHRAPPAPEPPPAWVPLESLETTLAQTEPSPVCSTTDRQWLTGRIDAVREELATMDWPLGTGLIHGDAWAGNLLWDTTLPGEVRLGDWDWVATGPREIDLIPTWHAVARYGRHPSWITQFTTGYGHDISRWPGLTALLAMRDLVQLTGPLRRATNPAYATTFRQRFTAIRDHDPAPWTAR